MDSASVDPSDPGHVEFLYIEPNLLRSSTSKGGDLSGLEGDVKSNGVEFWSEVWWSRFVWEDLKISSRPSSQHRHRVMRESERRKEEEKKRKRKAVKWIWTGWSVYHHSSQTGARPRAQAHPSSQRLVSFRLPSPFILLGSLRIPPRNTHGRLLRLPLKSAAQSWTFPLLSSPENSSLAPKASPSKTI